MLPVYAHHAGAAGLHPRRLYLGKDRASQTKKPMRLTEKVASIEIVRMARYHIVHNGKTQLMVREHELEYNMTM